MKVIGVTGGIGSGKSTVTEILRSLGASIIDADNIAREVVVKGGRALQELTEYFGTEILDNKGGLDRRKLGEKVFGDRDRLEKLNSITHKYIKERLLNKVSDVRRDSPSGILAIEVQIPFESWFRELVDEMWVVVSDREKRIERIKKRSGLTTEEVEKRINSQKNDKEYLSIAQRVIKNNGSMEDLRIQVNDLL